MKKNSFTEFFKGKGYYMLLFVGIIAIGAVAVVGSQLTSNQDKQENSVDINDVDDNIKADAGENELAENSQISEGIVKNAGDITSDTLANDDTTNEVADNSESNEDMIEYEGYAEDNDTTVQDNGQYAEADDAANASVETSTATAENEAVETLENLSFSVDDGLMWPVMGNVIMNYSMDHTIYFATLMQYKCNPAVIIDAEVGAEVKAAASGVVKSVEQNEETGLTVTMDIGNNYSLVYGQLADVNMKVGDLIQEGAVIGTVCEPTKYYSVEGSNLYFCVKEEDKTVNPMLLLR